MKAALALLSLFFAAQTWGAPSLALPVDCEMGKTCIVQNYVDRDPGPQARDYRCGFLTYDGHRGTDIRVIDAAVFRRGVPVLAAAAGRVRALRDGMADISIRETGKEAVAKREAGNSVVVEHGDGWESQYAHLRRGSIAVRAGDIVRAGQVLGMVGLSGYTEFGHLHLELRHRGRIVDPFVGESEAEPCKAGPNPLWSAQALATLAYVPTGVLGAGFAAAQPKLVNSSVDPQSLEPVSADARALVFWVHLYGVQAGDVEEHRLFGPAGAAPFERRGTIARNSAQSLALIGARPPTTATPWPGGVYRGEYTLYRGNPEVKVLSLQREIRIDAPPAERKSR